MNALQTVMILISFSTLLGYISARHLRVQPSVAILCMSLISIIALKTIDTTLAPIIYLQHISNLVNAANFRSVLIDLMLPMLLFAGAASLRTNLIKKRAVEISMLAIVSTLLSMIIIGFGLHWITNALNNPIPLIHCFLFGALISPTDPVAVVGMLKHANIEPEIEAKVAGESLFNDGIGIVMFLTIAQLIEDQSQAVTLSSTLLRFLTEVLGGLSIGIVSGLVCKRIMILQDTDTHTNLLISLFVVTGIYTLCNLVHISGALAVVACGLIISHHIEKHSHAKSVLRHFWGTLEEILNMILYLLIGFESINMSLGTPEIILSVSIIILALLTRSFTVILPFRTLLRHKKVSKQAERILIWGGLRGGLAIALALSIPYSPYHNWIMIATYAVVCFTNLIQGSTIRYLIQPGSTSTQ
ncbi:sodium:proton antiporter [Candidatus Comchoanobacter bicostacola]|uniref:Sodium:proton antiporter n=1 Tax=Candidatus Comchoanobacter bicostacola TaxID=2919598 RepID=A0ABY5DMT8_9GAMM|nr:sodium:proton antiporter [Candidatus Comchoanobacter bicostacola]UTC24937.1 sodium:proton antiporter [Candidatus Comchoanobacter bicostacola]